MKSSVECARIERTIFLKPANVQLKILYCFVFPKVKLNTARSSFTILTIKYIAELLTTRAVHVLAKFHTTSTFISVCIAHVFVHFILAESIMADRHRALTQVVC